MSLRSEHDQETRDFYDEIIEKLQILKRMVRDGLSRSETIDEIERIQKELLP